MTLKTGTLADEDFVAIAGNDGWYYCVIAPYVLMGICGPPRQGVLVPFFSLYLMDTPLGPESPQDPNSMSCVKYHSIKPPRRFYQAEGHSWEILNKLADYCRATKRLKYYIPLSRNFKK